MTKVVFSDGSRDWAHNLDDLRERWLLRRDQFEEVTHQTLPPIEPIDWLSPCDLPELISRQNLIKTKIDKNKLELTALWNGRNSMPQNWYAAQVLASKAELVYLEEIRRIIHSARERAQTAKRAEKVTRSHINIEEGVLNNSTLSPIETKLLTAFRNSDWGAVLDIVAFSVRVKDSSIKQAREQSKSLRSELGILNE